MVSGLGYGVCGVLLCIVVFGGNRGWLVSGLFGWDGVDGLGWCVSTQITNRYAYTHIYTQRERLTALPNLDRGGAAQMGGEDGGVDVLVELGEGDALHHLSELQ